MVNSFVQVITYGIIGIFNTLIHFTVFWLLLNLFGLQTIANLGGFLIAVSFSYAMNARFTFKCKPTSKNYMRMVIIMALVSLLFGAMGDFFKLYPTLTFTLYFIINPVLGFLLTKYFVFIK